jgi:hypothetical protein
MKLFNKTFRTNNKVENSKKHLLSMKEMIQINGGRFPTGIITE